MRIWSEIDSLITANGIKFQNESIDRNALSEQFAKSDYIVHHSKRFNDSVHFHYRIISKDRFETVILPYLNNTQTP